MFNVTVQIIAQHPVIRIKPNKESKIEINVMGVFYDWIYQENSWDLGAKKNQ